jgi:hypothetical protein
MKHHKREQLNFHDESGVPDLQKLIAIFGSDPQIPAWAWARGTKRTPPINDGCGNACDDAEASYVESAMTIPLGRPRGADRSHLPRWRRPL